MQEEISQTNNQSGLDKRQKFAIAVLGIVGVFFIVLWVVQLNQKLSVPFTYSEGNTPSAQISEQPQEDTAAVQKNKDTDGDGINDFDELNIYKTSPYLDDSDSDGIKDGQEIKNGTDPNCPEGKKCSAADVLEEKATSSASQTNPQAQNMDAFNNLFEQLSGQTGSGNAAGGQAPDAKTVDVKALRKSLLDAGISSKILNALTDAQILKSYQDTLGKVQQ